MLIAKADLAQRRTSKKDVQQRLSATCGPWQRQAEDQGFAYMAVECSIYMAEAMVRNSR